MKKILKTTVQAILAVSFMLSACGGPKGEIKSYALPNQTWLYADTLDFDYENTDSTDRKRLELNFRLNEKYPYRNLHAAYQFHHPSGRVDTNSAQFALSDPAGKWFVQPSMGGVYAFSEPLTPYGRFPELGKYRFRIIQYMRDDSLKGVESVSLSVNPEK